jgi:hypothetical protein
MEQDPKPFSYGKLLIKFDQHCISCTAKITYSATTVNSLIKYRSKEEFIDPVVLLFSDFNKLQSLDFNFHFAIELIEVSNWCRYGYQPAYNYPGTFVKNYVGLIGLVLLPEGFFQQHGFTPSHMPFGPPQSTYIRPRVKCQLKKYGKYFPHGPQLL